MVYVPSYSNSHHSSYSYTPSSEEIEKEKKQQLLWNIRNQQEVDLTQFYYETNAIPFINALCKNTSVRTIKFQKLNKNEVQKLSKVLQENRFIQQVFLYDSKFSNDSANALKEMLIRNQLIELHLLDNGILDEQAQLIFSGLKDNKSLKVLDLGGNNLTDDSINELLSILENKRTNLQVINIKNGRHWFTSSNHISKKIQLNLDGFLKRNMQLGHAITIYEQLNKKGNDRNINQFLGLVTDLKLKGHVNALNLTSLDLSDNVIELLISHGMYFDAWMALKDRFYSEKLYNLKLIEIVMGLEPDYFETQFDKVQVKGLVLIHLAMRLEYLIHVDFIQSQNSTVIKKDNSQLLQQCHRYMMNSLNMLEDGKDASPSDCTEEISQRVISYDLLHLIILSMGDDLLLQLVPNNEINENNIEKLLKLEKVQSAFKQYLGCSEVTIFELFLMNQNKLQELINEQDDEVSIQHFVDNKLQPIFCLLEIGRLLGQNLLTKPFLQGLVLSYSNEPAKQLQFLDNAAEYATKTEAIYTDESKDKKAFWNCFFSARMDIPMSEKKQADLTLMQKIYIDIVAKNKHDQAVCNQAGTSFLIDVNLTRLNAFVRPTTKTRCIINSLLKVSEENENRKLKFD